MSTRSPGRWLAIAASILVVATLVAAIVVMGSPGSQRESRLDRKREQDLKRIVSAIDMRTAAGKPLPADLAGLASEPGRRLSIVDPATGAPYAFEITGDRSYRLCAVFTTDTAEESSKAWIDEEWPHGPGRQCFERKASRRKG